MPALPPATCRYAAGLPHLDRRPLPEHDRTWLRRRLTRLRLHVGLALGVTAGIMAGAHAVAARMPALDEALHGGLGLGLVTLGSLGVLGCLGTRGWWRRLALLGVLYLLPALGLSTWWPDLSMPRWLTAEVLVGTTVLGLSYLGLGLARRLRLLRQVPRIRRDLAAGALDRYESEEPDRTLAPALAPLRTAGLLPAPETVRLEVLPRSGLVLRANGRRVERWMVVHLADVAPAQPHALRVDLPRGVAPAAPDPHLRLQRRSLTPQERAEIARHITRLRQRWWPAALLTVVVTGLVGWDLRTATASEGFPLDGASLGWLALLVVVYIGYGRRILAARRLEHDRRLRWVVTVHQDAADPRTDPPTLEVLPISQLAWTEKASPAGWRLSRL